MAKNWTMKEALEAVKNGDKEGCQDLGRRFPLTAIALAKNDIDTIINALPDHITARKIESVLKDGIVESESDEEIEEAEEPVKEDKKPTKKEKVVKATKEEKKSKPAKKEEPMNEPTDDDLDDEEEASDDYSKMNAIDLFKLCKKRGIKAEPKKKAADYIKLLKAVDANADSSDDDEEDDWDI